ncbi:uncharacterized protein LOC122848203 [Aphidius gifuensis]|uniref:uncharacterized protein LOC122848203 n=1 Tax=Aphidius gifuensis TaxID=684658 RepID=UPI001CDD28ED|nr:uncharacterized protein LOC122848203 [Aphidius gifuensis]XP_044002056.1 uncharacterized protein LOC122848203 [Aphidius gifuensis]
MSRVGISSDYSEDDADTRSIGRGRGYKLGIKARRLNSFGHKNTSLCESSIGRIQSEILKLGPPLPIISSVEQVSKPVNLLAQRSITPLAGKKNLRDIVSDDESSEDTISYTEDVANTTSSNPFPPLPVQNRDVLQVLYDMDKRNTTVLSNLTQAFQALSQTQALGGLTELPDGMPFTTHQDFIRFEGSDDNTVKQLIRYLVRLGGSPDKPRDIMRYFWEKCFNLDGNILSKLIWKKRSGFEDSVILKQSKFLAACQRALGTICKKTITDKEMDVFAQAALKTAKVKKRKNVEEEEEEEENPRKKTNNENINIVK